MSKSWLSPGTAAAGSARLVVLLPPVGSPGTSLNLAPPPASTSFALTGAVREVYAVPVLRWGHRDAVATLVFRREFCEHLASGEQPSIHSGRLATADGQVAGAWVVAGGFSTDGVTALAEAGALGVLVPRGTDDQGWMPKMIAGPAPVRLPVLAVRTDIHQRLTAASGAEAWACLRSAWAWASNERGRPR